MNRSSRHTCYTLTLKHTSVLSDAITKKNFVHDSKQTTKIVFIINIAMITLTRKLKKDGSTSSPDTSKRISVRDRLLIKEVQEMEQEMERNVCKVNKRRFRMMMPRQCFANWISSFKVVFNDPNVLSEFTLTITPGKLNFWERDKKQNLIIFLNSYRQTRDFGRVENSNSQ